MSATPTAFDELPDRLSPWPGHGPWGKRRRLPASQWGTASTRCAGRGQAASGASCACRTGDLGHGREARNVPRGRAGSGRAHHVLHADADLAVAVEGPIEAHDVRGVTLV